MAGAVLSRTPATRALDAAGVAYTSTDYDTDGRGDYGAQVTDTLGLDATTVGKTLVVRLDDGTHVVAVVPVAGTLDVKALARAAGAKRATMADPTDAERLAGAPPGGISPIGLRRRLPVFIDVSLTVVDQVHVSGGRRGLELHLAPDDLVRVTSATVADIAGSTARP